MERSPIVCLQNRRYGWERTYLYRQIMYPTQAIISIPRIHAMMTICPFHDCYSRQDLWSEVVRGNFSRRISGNFRILFSHRPKILFRRVGLVIYYRRIPAQICAVRLACAGRHGTRHMALVTPRKEVCHIHRDNYNCLVRARM